MKLKLAVRLFLLTALLISCGKDPLEPGNLVPPTVDQDLSIPAVEVNGTRLHLETFGNPSNPVMIFLHGGPGGDSRSLSRLVENYNGYSLTDEYFIVMFDQRGTGLSKRYGNMTDALTHSIPELTLENYLKDLEGIVNLYSPNEKVILFGHSWGGMYATMYLNEHPDKVAAVILSEPGSFNSEIEDDVEILAPSLTSEAISDLYWSHQNISPDNHESLDYLLVSNLYNALLPEGHHFDKTDMIPTFRSGAIATVNLYGSDGQKEDGTFTFDFTANLNQFNTKVLFINSDLSEHLSIAFQEKNRAFLPNTEMKIIEGVGHDLVWVAAEQHIEFIKEYLIEVL